MCFQRELATIPVRYVHYDVPKSEAYTLHSVGKHGFGEYKSGCSQTHTQYEIFNTGSRLKVIFRKKERGEVRGECLDWF